MRTISNRITKITGFGFGQVRVVVKAICDRNHAARHLAMWHAYQLWLSLKQTLTALAEAAAKATSTPARCTVPVRSPGMLRRPSMPRSAER